MTECGRYPAPMFGCKFEARYDKSAADLSNFKSIRGDAMDLIEATRKITYVRDVCVRCGKTIERVT